MKSFIASLLAALPSLARVQAYPSNRSHPVPLNNKTLIPLVVEGGACGYEHNENDAICGHGLCCNIETVCNMLFEIHSAQHANSGTNRGYAVLMTCRVAQSTVSPGIVLAANGKAR